MRPLLSPELAPVVQPYRGSLMELAGTYRGISRGRMMQVVVRENGGRLEFSEEDDDAPVVPTRVGDLTWASRGVRYIFRRVGGQMGELRVSAGYARQLLERIGS